MAKSAITDINKRLNELRDAAGPDEDPCGSEEAQQLLKELRRLNHIELNKLSVGNRLRLMFGQPLLKDEDKPKEKYLGGWICEFCFLQNTDAILPEGWDLVWQSPVCPSCRERVANDGGYAVVKGGAYAGGKPDPRA